MGLKRQVWPGLACQPWGASGGAELRVAGSDSLFRRGRLGCSVEGSGKGTNVKILQSLNKTIHGIQPGTGKHKRCYRYYRQEVGRSVGMGNG